MKRTLRFTLAGVVAMFGLALAVGIPTKAQAEMVTDRAIAVLHPTGGSNVTGTVLFTRAENGVGISATVEGLTPGKHGFHIHELGDCSAPDGTSAGGHYNPDGNPHAGPDQKPRHMGDLGNLKANTYGYADYERVDDYLSLDGPKSVVGRAVIVHAGEDDLSTQPTGAAGARQACGVIGYAKP